VSVYDRRHKFRRRAAAKPLAPRSRRQDLKVLRDTLVKGSRASPSM